MNELGEKVDIKIDKTSTMYWREWILVNIGLGFNFGHKEIVW